MSPIGIGMGMFSLLGAVLWIVAVVYALVLMTRMADALDRIARNSEPR